MDAGVRMSRDAKAKLMQSQYRAGRAARGVEPDGLARGRKRGVRQRKAERFADYLRGGRRAQELAASAGRRAGAATHFGGVLKRDLVLGETCADRLHLAPHPRRIPAAALRPPAPVLPASFLTMPGPSSSRADPYRTSPRPSHLCAWVAIASGGAARSPHRSDKAANPSCP